MGIPVRTDITMTCRVAHGGATWRHPGRLRFLAAELRRRPGPVPATDGSLRPPSGRGFPDFWLDVRTNLYAHSRRVFLCFFVFDTAAPSSTSGQKNSTRACVCLFQPPPPVLASVPPVASGALWCPSVPLLVAMCLLQSWHVPSFGRVYLHFCSAVPYSFFS